MAKAINRLSATFVSKCAKPGYYGDGNGLWLQVSGNLTKSWSFRFKRGGKLREMGLGALHTVTLAEAREKATEARKTLLAGIDPIEARRAQQAAMRAANAKTMTFTECAAAFIEANRAGWKNDKHAGQWESTLTTYCVPIFGDINVAAVDTGLVLKVLEPIWTTKAETASRLRGRIESVLDWATVRGYRSGDNPARWKGHLDKLLPKRSKVATVQHHPALAYSRIGAFMAALRGQQGMGARALEFAILTACRSGEVRGATWSEIDLEARRWIIPAGRMKAGKEHVVPLSDAALDLLRRLPRIEGTDAVFPNTKGAALSDMTLTAVIRRMNGDEAPTWTDAAGEAITAHGFRSTFRDWAGETTAYPREVIEHALAHQLRDRAEAAYARGSLLDKRARLMADWATCCAKAQGDAGNVTPIRGAA